MIAAQALLFPVTDPAPSALAGLLKIFREIMIYRLPAAGSPGGDEWLSLAAGQGRVLLKDVSFFDSMAEAAAVLADFQTWAGQFRNPGDLSILRGPLTDDAEEPPSRLIQAIRGKQPRKADPDREAQIFLHLVEHYDRQQGEIDQLVQRAMQKENLLGELVGVEDAGDEFDTLAPGPRLADGVDAGAEMMLNRLSAWSRFLEKFGELDTILVTDRPEAVSILDIHLARRIRPGGSFDGRTMEVLEPLFDLPLDTAFLPGPDLTPEVPSVGEPWVELSDFVEKLASQTWKASDLEALKTEARTLVGNKVDASADGKGPLLTCYLVPGENLVAAFKAAAGRSSSPITLDRFCGPVFEVKRGEG